MARNVYSVEYKMHSASSVKRVDFVASNKADAYYTAVYQKIPEMEDGELPYSAWVSSVTYQNGNYKIFNNFEGNPY